MEMIMDSMFKGTKALLGSRRAGWECTAIAHQPAHKDVSADAAEPGASRALCGTAVRQRSSDYLAAASFIAIPFLWLACVRLLPYVF